MIYLPLLILLAILFALVWNIAIFGGAYRRRMRDHPFPDRKTVRVVYCERKASGNSDKSQFSRVGGARNCLNITVTPTELWVFSHDFLAAISEKSDLDHRIPFSQIVDLQRTGKRRVRVSFNLPDGEVRTLKLGVRSPEKLIEAIQAGRWC